MSNTTDVSNAIDAIFNKIINGYNTTLKHREVVGFRYAGQYMRRVGCTHAAPRGKPTNFFSSDNLPTYYPGINGRVWFKILLKSNEYESDFQLERHTLLHTGTGGSGGYDGPWTLDDLQKDEHRSSYHAKVFLDDFPEMQSLEDEWIRTLGLLKKNIMCDRLVGKKSVLLKDEYYESHHCVPVEFFWEKQKRS